ncbi:uncharacterized protein LOC112501158 [Cynara cardunculus var. scolymus]|uniref:uncharacterized protein LOC112501158 n=1 Tax=Cynara cardunculus var. scolymus TaxID=59895 RepID=UPI000D626BFB|nr:uncharacterized protein LOC112501158 [Cynara cardunculus var. scolymus]
MDPQLLMPSPPMDFDFDSTTTSPYATAPSSPRMFSGNFFYSAPTSPTRSSFFHHLSPISPHDAQSTVPSQNLHRNKDEDEENDIDMDFAFDFSGQLERPSISDADELFHGGKIKPLDPPPPPRLRSSNDPPRSPTLSPRNSNKKYVDHFSETLHQTPIDQTQNPSPRGRERTTTTTTTKHKASRSLSPFRVSDILPDDGNNQKVSTNQSFPFGFTWYNKWNLKNLLLFRSTSEGSATTSNDPLKKYAMITKGEQDVKNSSFRSNDGDGSVGGSSRRMKRKVSAHEIHYTANRAVAEEMRRKTFLPYKSGLLGCLGFHHNLHEVSRGR